MEYVGVIHKTGQGAKIFQVDLQQRWKQSGNKVSAPSMVFNGNVLVNRGSVAERLERWTCNSVALNLSPALTARLDSFR